MQPQTKIDKIDATILKNLLRDARTKFSDIAQECNISTNAIAKRFQKLKNLGIIRGTSLKVNTELFGYRYVITVDINIESGQEKQVKNELKKISHIITSYRVVGRYDLHVVILVKTFQQISAIRDSIRRIKGVIRIGLTANLDKVKFLTDNIEI